MNITQLNIVDDGGETAYLANLDIIVDGHIFAQFFLGVLCIASLLLYIYVERIKSFEKFNVNSQERNYMIKKLCIVQAIPLSYFLSYI